ncbi:Predicted arabinose efflux permease, MFS family [Andreprevotia lacus DSM 23236]|jgi:MFS family permease|uniref:Predicted arabinose efflux permease, MFS family n=1 Tax=Andreprevotia lacus DSM 23236 TaxID=1121001 RepID=A0A1W1X289_9NEIS|nr:MFS transporter [Andreprevotia lacus]SMC18066.1 Predicted arabinose efflux permease, MFS family [Andreprevotia lacus DSM 23236]
MDQPSSLFKNHNFFLLWLASVVGNFALAVATIAETWYVVKTLGAKEQLGLVMIAGSVPRIVLMLFGGVVADRMKRSRIILGSLGLRVLLMFALVGLLMQGWLDIWVMTGFAFIYGALDAFFWPARDALLPGLVNTNDLTRANSIMLTTNQIGLVFGPVLGGALLALVSYEWVFSITGVLLLVGVCCIGLIKEADVVSSGARRHILHELLEGLQYAIRTPVLLSLMLIYAIANLLFMGPLGLGIPIVVTDHLHGEASTLSYLQSAFAVGMVLGGTLLTIYPPVKKRLLMIALVIAVEGVLLGLQGHTYWLWAALVLQFLLGFGVVSNNVPMMSLLQQYTDRDKIGRVMSLNTVASMGLSPISYAMVTSLLSLHVEIKWIMPVFGLTMSVLMLAMVARMPTIRQVD